MREGGQREDRPSRVPNPPRALLAAAPGGLAACACSEGAEARSQGIVGGFHLQSAIGGGVTVEVERRVWMSSRRSSPLELLPTVIHPHRPHPHTHPTTHGQIWRKTVSK